MWGSPPAGHYFQEGCSVVWRISDPPCDDPLAVTHLFAGSFHGWGQAHVATLDIPSTVPSSLNSWSPTPAQITILSDVAEQGLLHAIPWTGVHVATASPPCPPWSRAGGREGLADPHGLTFITALVWARQAAPIALLIECVDALPSRPHFPIIQAAIQWAGYVILHAMVHDHPCSRKRWLAVLLRHDVPPSVTVPGLPFRCPTPTPWHHASFQVSEAPTERDQPLRTLCTRYTGNTSLRPPPCLKEGCSLSLSGMKADWPSSHLPSGPFGLGWCDREWYYVGPLGPLIDFAFHPAS